MGLSRLRPVQDRARLPYGPIELLAGNIREYDGRMRMRQVEAFRAVMISGGVTGAAALLHVSQPSVSRLIADLEHEVGFPLFERRGGRLHATPQARALYEVVRRSFAGLDVLAQAARRIRAHPVGTIRIASLAALAVSALPPALSAFGRLHPEVKVTVEALGQRDLEDRIVLGQADLGFGIATPSRPGLRTAPLADAPYVCAVPREHRLAARKRVRVADLAGERLIGPMHEVDALWYGIDHALTAAGIEVQRQIECQHSLPVYALVEAGLGVAIVEPFSARLFAARGVRVRRLEPRVTVAFASLEPDAGPTPGAVESLRAAMQDALASCLAQVERATSEP
jgi:DNA-binding transcriptional LysR family regulator